MRNLLKASILLLVALTAQSSATLTHYTFEGQMTHLYPAWEGATGGYIAQQPSYDGTPVTYILAIDLDADGTLKIYGQEPQVYPDPDFMGNESFYADIVSGDYLTSVDGGNPNYHTVGEDAELQNYGTYSAIFGTTLYVNSWEDTVNILPFGNNHPSNWTVGDAFWGWEWAGSPGVESLSEIRFQLTLTDISEIPEPVSLSLFALGGLVLLRKRK